MADVYAELEVLWKGLCRDSGVIFNFLLGQNGETLFAGASRIHNSCRSIIVHSLRGNKREEHVRFRVEQQRTKLVFQGRSKYECILRHPLRPILERPPATPFSFGIRFRQLLPLLPTTVNRQNSVVCSAVLRPDRFDTVGAPYGLAITERVFRGRK